jgi:hypothetical protein
LAGLAVTADNNALLNCGGSGILGDDELARAIRCDSATAVRHWWGVTADRTTRQSPVRFVFVSMRKKIAWRRGRKATHL